ncbi:MAG TPA: M20/M25/M40 family metallo-hydrolase [Spirochaetota bacterium]|nr:M20/M25/M40 family metallo-hydrolase [Spirochaetota bacterium]HNT11104.1 M20/M25/M40 family metallo-hydrolase [Spirochaetota bacterium]
MLGSTRERTRQTNDTIQKMTGYPTHDELTRLTEEMLHHFRNLLRIDTTNPPGNESTAAHYIAHLLRQEGIDHTVIEPEPGRGSLIARIYGDRSKRPLLLMAHLDVVCAEAEHWEHPPFAAHLEDGVVWGRGALDCKNTVVLWLTVMIALKRAGVRPARDVIFLAAADEEEGGRLGAGWIVENAFELIDAEACLNEGGGPAIGFLGRTFYTYQSGEKGNIWLRFTRTGTPGHGSVPRGDNPVMRVGKLLERIMRVRFPVRATATTREMLRAIATTQRFPQSLAVRLLAFPPLSELLIRRGIADDEKANTIRSILRTTVCPTVLRGGRKVNVIPSEASLEIDIRVLPGHDINDVFARIRRALGPDTSYDILDLQFASESPVDHELVRAIRRVIERHHPGANTLPLLLPAASDGSYLRRKGIAVYGFSPLLPGENIGLIHGHNERISVDSLAFSLRIGLEVVLEYVM